MHRPVIFLLTILFTGVPGAAWAADNIPLNRTVVSISTYDNYAVVKFSPEFANNLACGGGVQNTHVVVFFDTNPNKKAQLALVMMAMSLKQKIGFGINGCFGWGGGIPIVYRVGVAD
ncbi:MAG: hypothetical protein ACE1ZS_08845 [Candidatus Poribacteria bacterium]